MLCVAANNKGVEMRLTFCQWGAFCLSILVFSVSYASTADNSLQSFYQRLNQDTASANQQAQQIQTQHQQWQQKKLRQRKLQKMEQQSQQKYSTNWEVNKRTNKTLKPWIKEQSNPWAKHRQNTFAPKTPQPRPAPVDKNTFQSRTHDMYQSNQLRQSFESRNFNDKASGQSTSKQPPDIFGEQPRNTQGKTPNIFD